LAKEDKGKVKMTVIHFETESDNATLQENIRSIAHTLSRALTQPTRVIHTPAQLSSGDGSNGNAILELPVEEQDFDEAIDVSSKPARSKAGKTSTSRQPVPLDLDLTSGDMPLKTFLENKNLDTDIKRYLAIAYWFKHHRNTAAITMDHAYTAYRFVDLGWNVPKDPSGPFRAMKQARYGWMGAGSEKGSYAINHIGENEVLKMGGN
jgi:hypothetical protein